MMSQRREARFTLKTAAGPLKTFTVLDTVTVDDLVRIGLKAYVREKRTGEVYESPFSEEVRRMITTSRVSLRS